MKKYLLQILKTVLKSFSLKDKIIFESLPDLEGNSRAVFDEMICRGYNERYQFYWIVEDKGKYKNYPVSNVFFHNKPHSLIIKISYLFKLGNAKFKITENDCIPKVHPFTFGLHLGHGAPIKSTKTWLYLEDKADYAVSLSEAVKENSRKSYNFESEKMICTGYPRNDLLFENSKKETSEKYILWLPTFREHRMVKRVDSNYHFKFGIPIFQTEQQIIELNKILNKQNIKLYIKPHFSANTKKIKNINLSNIKIIDDSFYKQRNQLFYEFVGKSHALITDYSSIYFDYLLTDKPMAVTLDDYEEYKRGVGIVIENYNEVTAAFKIEKFEQLKQFIESLENPASLLEQLRWEKIHYHDFIDNHATNRVIEFLKTHGL